MSDHTMFTKAMVQRAIQRGWKTPAWHAKRWWRRARWGDRCHFSIPEVPDWECNIPSWMNPPKDHRGWLGHDWVRR